MPQARRPIRRIRPSEVRQAQRLADALKQAQGRALEVRCPVCRAEPDERCHGAVGDLSHTARELLVWAADDAIRAS